mmetsp:Transcript_27898/g.50338  ORF Transcript_27898/g.50338 Transcript_27898/m.50338 type:complete len:232 (-) Transcript_27898:50-745(-)
MFRPVTPGKLETLTAVLDSNAMTPHEVESYLDELGIDKHDESVQAILVAYQADHDIAEEVEVTSDAASPMSRNHHSTESIEVCGHRYLPVDDDFLQSPYGSAYGSTFSQHVSTMNNTPPSFSLADGHDGHDGEIVNTGDARNVVDIPTYLPEQLLANQEVLTWLKSLELGQYAPIFEDYGITANELPNLSGQTLQGMGIENAQHRAMLLRELANFQTVDEEIEVQDVEELT